MKRSKLLLLFIDGMGLGNDGPENPLARLFAEVMDPVRLVRTPGPRSFENGVLVPADAVLGVPGMPQSATGQTSIFAGINAQAMLGVHLSAFPNDALRDVIEERSLMKVLRSAGVAVTSANLYSDEFFEKRANSRRNTFPVSTLTIRASGVGFRYPADFLAGRAVFADITNALIRERGYDVPLIEPEEAAIRMLNILEDHEFVFFEYFMTDLHGHKRNTEALGTCVEVLNRFVGAVWEGAADEASILITSDHGNAEDMDVAGHTSNAVPAILLTRDREAARRFAQRVRALPDVYYAVLDYFDVSTDRIEERSNGKTAGGDVPVSGERGSSG